MSTDACTALSSYNHPEVGRANTRNTLNGSFKDRIISYPIYSRMAVNQGRIPRSNRRHKDLPNLLEPPQSVALGTPSLPAAEWNEHLP